MVIDAPFPARLLAQAAADWPAADWPGWHCYHGGDGRDDAGKLAADGRLAKLPTPCRELLGLMALECPFPGAIPDLTLWGGGMHAMPAGSRLGLHLDADRHPAFGLERAGSSVLFVGPWEPTWGGELRLWTPDARGIIEAITPRHGRLVTFPVDDAAYHDVAEVRCPPGVMRRTLALFWCKRPAPGEGKRARARFV